MTQATYIVLVIWMALSGCSERPTADAKSGLRTTNMTIGDRAFTLEVADTESSRETGLMRRDSMPANRGMIFVFRDERDRSFWMKNTRIPLDIIYLDGDGRVVSIKTMKPFDTTSVPSDGPAKYAIELNAGMAAKAGVKRGDVLNVPADAREPAGVSGP